MQYFAWLLGTPGEGERIIYAEGLADESAALDLLATHRVDTGIGHDFFDDSMRRKAQTCLPKAHATLYNSWAIHHGNTLSNLEC